MLPNNDNNSSENTELDDTKEKNIPETVIEDTTYTTLDHDSLRRSNSKDGLFKSTRESARSSDTTEDHNSFIHNILNPIEGSASEENIPELAQNSAWFSLAFFTMKPTVANAGLLILMAGAAMLVYGLVIASTPLIAAGALTAGTGTLLAMYGHYSKPRVDAGFLPDDSDLSYNSNIATSN
jgi:hypothetical protein